jgi:hypothetical protein
MMQKIGGILKITSLIASLVLAAITYPSQATAQDDDTVNGGGDPVDGAPKTMVVGAHGDVGMAHVVGNDSDDKKVRFAGGGGAYIDFYLNPMLALEVGIGVVGKGYSYRGPYVGSVYCGTTTVRLIYMEIPLGAKLNIKNFQASLLFAPNFALWGKTTSDSNACPPSEHVWGDQQWGRYRRFNFGPKIVLGYAIPIGPVSLVPGFYWSMNLLDNNYPASYHGPHATNYMFRVALEFGF